MEDPVMKEVIRLLTPISSPIRIIIKFLLFIVSKAFHFLFVFSPIFPDLHPGV